jgi:hypothetical protein
VPELKNIAQPVRAYRVTGTPTIEVAVPRPVSDKPSIAVLPFTNMSGDPEQEYFSDGLTEDIITELSRFKNLLVVARNSSFTFKGQAADVKEVGQSSRLMSWRAAFVDQAIAFASLRSFWKLQLANIFGQSAMIATWKISSWSRTNWCARFPVVPGQFDRHAVENMRRNHRQSHL